MPYKVTERKLAMCAAFISWNPVAIAEWLAVTRSANGRSRSLEAAITDFRLQFAHKGVENVQITTFCARFSRITTQDMAFRQIMNVQTTSLHILI